MIRSSVHHFRQRAKAAMDEARSAVAALIGADPSEVVFTSGGTESDNFAIRGASRRSRPLADATYRHQHRARGGPEHPEGAGQTGRPTTLLRVDATGIVAPDASKEALTDDTAIVSVMHANNEIGTIQPISELARMAHDRVLFIPDAVQTAGKSDRRCQDARRRPAVRFRPISFTDRRGGARSGSGGAAFVAGTDRWQARAEPTGGTENVAGIVGMGVAATLAAAKIDEEATRISALRDRLEEEVLRAVPGTIVNGARSLRVPNTTNISFDRTEAESLLIALDLEGVAVSTGSACSSGTLEPSHVLKAMGLTPHRTQNSIRFSLGAGNSEADVDRVVAILPGIVEKLRSLTRVPARA